MLLTALYLVMPVGRIAPHHALIGGLVLLDRALLDDVRQVWTDESSYEARVAALAAALLEPNGTVCWTWDFVREVMDFEGDRWDGKQWQQHKKGKPSGRSRSGKWSCNVLRLCLRALRSSMPSRRASE